MLFKILKDQFFSKKVINVERTKIERLYLKVPYQNKDIAKRMGARWDEIKKKWYIPTSHQAIEKFSAWLPDLILKAQYFHLARTSRMCYNCGYDVAYIRYCIT